MKMDISATTVYRVVDDAVYVASVYCVCAEKQCRVRSLSGVLSSGIGSMCGRDARIPN